MANCPPVEKDDEGVGNEIDLSKNQSRRTVLFIGETAARVAKLEAVLAPAGVALEGVATGRLALKRLFEGFRPDAVLLDLYTKDIDGRRICRLLRRDERLLPATTPIVLVSPLLGGRTAAHTLDRLGANAFIDADDDEEALGRRLVRILFGGAPEDPLAALIVDRIAALATSIAQAFEQRGYSTTVAHDVRVGLEQLDAKRPAVVVWDAGCTDEKGALPLSLFSAKRSSAIVITAEAPGFEKTADLIEKGAEHVQAKPFDPARLASLCDAIRRERVILHTARTIQNQRIRELAMQKRIRQQRTELQTILDSVPALIYYKDRSHRFVRCNVAFAETFSIRPAQVLGSRACDVDIRLPPSCGLEALEADEQLMRDGLPRVGIVEPYEGEGGRRWLRTDKVPYRDESGAVVGLIGLSTDITARLRAQEQRERLRRALEQVEESIVITDESGIILDANQAFVKSVGRSLAELEGEDFKALWSGSYLEEVRSAIERSVSRGMAWSGHLVRVAFDGSRVDEEVTLSPYRDSEGRLAGFVAIKRDVTEELKLQSQLLQAQKMEAIGQLAGGIAHDFNNLLVGIIGHTSMLKLDSPDAETLQEAIETIDTAARRASELTKQLLGFARIGKNREVPCSIDRLVREVLALLERTLGKNIRISTRFSDSGITVRGDPSQLQQVLLNLAVNARDAMPEGGELDLETAVVELAGAHALGVGLEAGRYARVVVRDTGCGIGGEIKERIFEPFFTTKDKGKGTGLGLATVYGIVKNHGGAVRVQSDIGRGTNFEVFLPLAQSPALPSSPPPRDGLITGSGRILVVDDEEVVRRLAHRLLTRLGYEVVTVPSGAEAVEYLETSADRVDLAIIDLNMPGMDGKECFGALKKIRPDLLAVLSTGYGHDGKAQEALDTGMVGFIAKPYNIHEMSAAVAAALEATVPEKS